MAVQTRKIKERWDVIKKIYDITGGSSRVPVDPSIVAKELNMTKQTVDLIIEVLINEGLLEYSGELMESSIKLSIEGAREVQEKLNNPDKETAHFPKYIEGETNVLFTRKGLTWIAIICVTVAALFFILTKVQKSYFLEKKRDEVRMVVNNMIAVGTASIEQLRKKNDEYEEQIISHYKKKNRINSEQHIRAHFRRVKYIFDQVDGTIKKTEKEINDYLLEIGESSLDRTNWLNKEYANFKKFVIDAENLKSEIENETVNMCREWTDEETLKNALSIIQH